MPAVRGRVDEDGAVGGEHDVACPQVAVDASGWPVVVEVAGREPVAHAVDGAGPGRVEVTAVEGPAHEGAHPLLGVEQAPRRRRVVRLRLAPDPGVTGPAGRGRPEGRRARSMGHGETPPEGLGCLLRRTSGVQPDEVDVPGTDAADLDDAGAAARLRLPEPAQTGRLDLEEAGGGSGPRLPVGGGGARHRAHASRPGVVGGPDRRGARPRHRCRHGTGACDRPDEALACRASASRSPGRWTRTTSRRSDARRSAAARRAAQPARPRRGPPLGRADPVALRGPPRRDRRPQRLPRPRRRHGHEPLPHLRRRGRAHPRHRGRHDSRRPARGLRPAPALDRPGQLRRHPQPAGPRTRRGLRRGSRDRRPGPRRGSAARGEARPPGGDGPQGGDDPHGGPCHGRRRRPGRRVHRPRVVCRQRRRRRARLGCPRSRR